MEKVKYNAGDVVTIRQEIPSPDMIVAGKTTTEGYTTVEDGNVSFNSKRRINGVKCFWFAKTGEGFIYQEAVFDFKDLSLVKRYNNYKRD